MFADATPNGARASSMAEMMQAIAGIVPPSPAPFAPIGLSEEAISRCSISTRGISGAVGKRYSP